MIAYTSLDVRVYFDYSLIAAQNNTLFYTTMPATVYTRERQILEFISQFIQRYGYAPTLKEIGEALGMASPATVHEHIDKLRQRGFIKTRRNRTRS